MPQTPETQKKSTELEVIFGRLQEENNRFVSALSGLEKIGEKLKNTNYPKEASDKEPIKDSDGILSSILMQLTYTAFHNNRLEELQKKFESLL